MTRSGRGERLAPLLAYGRLVREQRSLFHICLAVDWERAQHDEAITDSTRDVTLAAEGFVHCSYADQLAATVARFYGDLDEIVVLRIDADRLTSPLVVEDLAGTGEAFPHVYGPIDLAAVVDVDIVSPHDIGSCIPDL